jgi:hypothetical protein
MWPSARPPDGTKGADPKLVEHCFGIPRA